MVYPDIKIRRFFYYENHKVNIPIIVTLIQIKLSLLIIHPQFTNSLIIRLHFKNFEKCYSSRSYRS